MAGAFSCKGRRRREDEELIAKSGTVPEQVGSRNLQTSCGASLVLLRCLIEMRKRCREGRSVGLPTRSQQLPDSMIWLGGGTHSLWKGKRLLSIGMGVVAPSVLQSMYFPCGLKKLFIGMVMCIMKHERASGTFICVHISPFPLLHHMA